MEWDKIKTLEDLKQAKAAFYKEGSDFKKLQNEIKTAAAEKRSEIGKKISDMKTKAEEFFNKRAKEIESALIDIKVQTQWEDVSKPTTSISSLHPLTLVENRFKDWLKQNGYFESAGSEIETDEYNFERLNIPKDHPAREMQDSLYIDEQTLLRTHNTGFSARELEMNKNKSFSHFAIGPVYRNDEDDATHSHQFTQVDFVSVGFLSFPNLLFTLKELISYVLEENVKIRTRPSYFPFTEPSVEVDIFYKEKWIEVLGAGMLHDNVLKAAGYTNDMSAFAAGIGVERIAMIKYGINDIRELYKNDIRFLNQFKGGR